MQSLSVQVINLDRDTSRLAAIRRDLSAIGLEFTRLPASDGSTLDPSLGAAARRNFGRTLNAGEIGCFQSHRRAAKAFLATDAELGLVLEDDAHLDADSMQVIERLRHALPGFTLWDVINLARPVKRWRTPLRASVWQGPPILYHAHYMPVTTTALLWSRGGAQMFLTMTPDMTAPVDVAIQQWAARSDRGLAFDVPPISVRDYASTIQTGIKRSREGREADYTFLRLKRQFDTHRQAIASKRLRRSV